MIETTTQPGDGLDIRILDQAGAQPAQPGDELDIRVLSQTDGQPAEASDDLGVRVLSQDNDPSGSKPDVWVVEPEHLVVTAKDLEQADTDRFRRQLEEQRRARIVVTDQDLTEVLDQQNQQLYARLEAHLKGESEDPDLWGDIVDHLSTLDNTQKNAFLAELHRILDAHAPEAKPAVDQGHREPTTLRLSNSARRFLGRPERIQVGQPMPFQPDEVAGRYSNAQAKIGAL